MKIAIELPTWLGDTVMATPAIENLANFFNDSELILIGSPIAIETLKSHPKVTKTYIIEKNYINLYNTLNSLEEFDLFFSFRGSIRSKFIKFFIPSKKKYQFDKEVYIKEHQVEKYNNFINDSINNNIVAKSLTLWPKEKSKGKRKKLLGINPGSSYGSSKRWDSEEFAAVAYALAKQYDIIIFGGPGEKDIANDIERCLIDYRIENYLNVAGKTSITELIYQILNLDLFITGDSGPMHIAAAFKVPTISIFGPTDDSKTSQWMNTKSVIVKKNLDCQPCMKRKCPLGHHNCMSLIKAQDVLQAIEVFND
jgi:heptosyltransferase II